MQFFKFVTFSVLISFWLADFYLLCGEVKSEEGGEEMMRKVLLKAAEL